MAPFALEEDLDGSRGQPRVDLGAGEAIGDAVFIIVGGYLDVIIDADAAAAPLRELVRLCWRSQSEIPGGPRSRSVDIRLADLKMARALSTSAPTYQASVWHFLHEAVFRQHHSTAYHHYRPPWARMRPRPGNLIPEMVSHAAPHHRGFGGRVREVKHGALYYTRELPGRPFDRLLSTATT